MARKVFAQIGSFAMKPGAQKGIHIYEYDPETAVFTHVMDDRPELNAGQSGYNREKDVIYVTDENRGEGGGGVYTCRLDHTTGTVTWLGQRPTLSTLPSYVGLTQSGRFALVPHHGTGTIVTKTVQDVDGRYIFRSESDDGTLVLIDVNPDGTLGDIRDVVWHPVERDADGKLKKVPHLHCCVLSPDGGLFFVCDKGLDRVFIYRVDEENGKLILLNSAPCPERSMPRYALFHPTLPCVYQNNEHSAYIHVWRYGENGALASVQRIRLLESEEESAAYTEEGASDMRLTSDGKYLYAAIRGLNLIASYAVEADGTLRLLQNIPCGGRNPRGVCLSPDEKFFFALNRDTNNIVRFLRRTDGTLEKAGEDTFCNMPCNMQFITYDA